MIATSPIVITSPEQWPPANLSIFLDPDTPPQEYQTTDGLHFVAGPDSLASIESTNTYGYKTTYKIMGGTSLSAAGTKLGERKTVEGVPETLLPLHVAPGLVVNVGASSLNGIRVATTEEVNTLLQQGRLLTPEKVDEIDRFDLI